MNEQLRQLEAPTPDSSELAAAEFSFPSARGGRKPQIPVTIEVVRELTEDDLETLLAPEPVAAPGQKLLALRHSHHQLAQLLAKGLEHGEVSLITGYSLAYISVMMADPAFRELLDYYAGVRELVFVDVLERMKALGLSTLDELQERLAMDPGKFSQRDLMELTELLLVKGRGAPGGGAGTGGGASPVTVSVQFVTSKTPQASEVIEGEFVTGGETR